MGEDAEAGSGVMVNSSALGDRPSMLVWGQPGDWLTLKATGFGADWGGGVAMDCGEWSHVGVGEL